MVQPQAFRSQVRSSEHPRRDTRPNVTAPGFSVPGVCLGPRAFQPRVPSVGLTSPCGQVSRARPAVRKNVSRLGHHLHCRWVTRLVTVMGRHRQLSRARHRRCRRLGGVSLRGLVRPSKMPLTNLCNRLLLSRAPTGVPTPKPATYAAWPVAPCPILLPTPEREQQDRTVLDDVG
jgi:hypothetical protein